MAPSSTSSSPASMRSAVVLPEPDGPTSTMNSPSPIFRSRASTAGASVPGYVRVACSNLTSAIVGPPSQFLNCAAELLAQALLSVALRMQRVQSEQRRTHDRGRARRADCDRRPRLGEQPLDVGEDAVGGSLEQSTAEQDLHGLVLEAEPGERD